MFPRKQNARADVLSKLASTERKGWNKSVIQEILPQPSTLRLPLTLGVFSIGDNNCLMTPMHEYLTKGKPSADSKQAVMVRRRAFFYVLVKGKLYRRVFSIPLLKYVDRSGTDHVLLEIH